MKFIPLVKVSLSQEFDLSEANFANVRPDTLQRRQRGCREGKNMTVTFADTLEQNETSANLRRDTIL